MFGPDDFIPPYPPGRRARLRGWIDGRAGQWLSNAAAREGATIMVYHSVADVWGGNWIDPRFWIPAPTFAKHLAFFKASRNVVSLADLADDLKNGRPLKPGTVVLTFDDAYLDHQEVAHPLLQEHGLPATFFVPTGWVGHRAPWGDELYSVIRHRRETRLDLGDWGRFDLKWPGQPRRAFEVLADKLIHTRTHEERTAVIENVRQQLETYGLPPRRTMTWDEVRDLAGRPDVILGAHGAEHLSLPSIPADDQRVEVSRSIDDLTRELGARPRYFAYPYGHYDQTSDAVLAELGFDAVTVAASGEPRIDAAADPLHLPRCEAHPDLGRLARWTR